MPTERDDDPAGHGGRIIAGVMDGGYALQLPTGALDAAEFDAAVTAAHRRLGGWSAVTTGLGAPARRDCEGESVSWHRFAFTLSRSRTT